MSGVLFSNESFYDKNYNKTFAEQEQYKFVGIGSTFSTLVPFYKKLLTQVIGNNANNEFKDYALSTLETEQIRSIFGVELDRLLPHRESQEPSNFTLEWKGNTYDIKLSLFCPNNRRILKDYEIIQIADECLSENKPMYLSISNVDTED